MTYKVLISDPASEDLEAIYSYIAFTLLAPDTAARQIERLKHEILSLNTMPKRYRAYDSEPWHSRGLRQMVVDKYVVLYLPDDDTQTVNIARIVYGGRNIDAILSEVEK